MRRLFIAAAAFLQVACLGGAATDPADTASANPLHFSATIDGIRWSATRISGGISSSGGFSLTGFDLSPINAKEVSLTLSYIPGPGTYPLGVGPAFSGGIGMFRYREPPFQQWISPESGNAGFITIREVTPTRMVGTFEFTGIAVTFGSPILVTSGDFDVPLTNLYGATVNPANEGMKVTGTVRGTPFYAGQHYSNGFGSFPNKQFTLVVSDTTYKLDFYLSEVDTAGTYVLGTGARRSVAVSTMTASPTTWGGTNATSAGTFVLTSITASRLKGTVNATLQATGSSTAPPMNINIALEVRRN